MENKITNIKQRVLQIIDCYKISKEKFFNSIDMTSANFRGNAKNSLLNSNAIENIITIYPDINPTWLLTGKGEMLDSQPVTKSIINGNIYDKETLDILKKELADKRDIIKHLIKENDKKSEEIEGLKSELAFR